MSSPFSIIRRAVMSSQSAAAVPLRMPRPPTRAHCRSHRALLPLLPLPAVADTSPLLGAPCLEYSVLHTVLQMSLNCAHHQTIRTSKGVNTSKLRLETSLQYFVTFKRTFI